MRAAWLLVLSACGRLGFEEDLGPGACPTLEAIRTGTMTIGASETAARAPLTVDLDRSVLWISVAQAEPSPRHGAVVCELTATEIACLRPMAGTDYPASTGQIAIQWSVTTFADGVRVQRGVSPANTPVALQPVGDHGLVVLSGAGPANDGASWGTDEFVRATLQGDRLLLETIGSQHLVGWQVVTMAGTTVQRGEFVLSAGERERDVPIAPVELERTVVLESHTADSSGTLGIGWELVGVALADEARLRFDRADADRPLSIAWQVATLPFAVARGRAEFVAGAAAVNAAVPGADPATTLAIGTGQSLLGPATGRGTTTAAVPDLVGEATVTLRVEPDQVRLARGSALAPAQLDWAAIDLARCAP